MTKTDKRLADKIEKKKKKKTVPIVTIYLLNDFEIIPPNTTHQIHTH